MKTWDILGDEALHASFIIVMTFVGVAGLLIAASADILNYSQSKSDLLEGWETIGGLEYNFWTPTAGFAVTPNDTQIEHSYEGAFDIFLDHYDDPAYYYAFAPPYGSSHNVRVYVVRNNSWYDPGSNAWYKQFQNAFVLTRLTTDHWFFHTTKKAVIPFESLIEDAGRPPAAANASYASCMLGSMNCTLFVTANGNLTQRLYFDDNYTIGIGTEFGTALGKASMWTILGQLLTMRLPETHWAIKAILAIPIWAGLGFLAVTIISRFIPFVGGG